MPFTYTQEDRERIAKAVITGLSAGIPLTVLCRDDGMPCDDTVRNWAEEDVELDRAIARARVSGWDQIAHNTRATARGNGDSTGDVARDKLIIDTDFKLLAKWDPKRYGDKQLIGSDPDNPLPAGFLVEFANAPDKT